VGAEVVGLIPALRGIVPLVRSHHEKVDGSGYPDGLRGDQIPLGARILAVADAFSAMTSDRPYRQAVSKGMALEELRRNAGTQFDPIVIQAFESVVERLGRGARMSDARRATLPAATQVA
jgi:HD-GYP domain-containing protein (c-di-GMP phosphodiesterase class II)